MGIIPSLAGQRDLRWLDDAACAELGIDKFFVEAGHVIEESTLNVCRGCPVRADCVEHAYVSSTPGGYYGGLSPGQRREMDLDEALEYITKDPVRPLR